MAAIVFYIFSAITVLFAFLVISVRNPVTSALSLVASFFGISGMFVLLHAPFLGIVQILIYAGAILVLFLYVTMLLNVRATDSAMTHPWRRRLLAGGVAAFIAVALFCATAPRDLASAPLPGDFGSVASAGRLLLGPYALLFELISLVLLAGIIGTVVLAQRKAEKGKE
jgi:NADH-quinone oxidoreductase subunit J